MWCLIFFNTSWSYFKQVYSAMIIKKDQSLVLIKLEFWDLTSLIISMSMIRVFIRLIIVLIILISHGNEASNLRDENLECLLPQQEQLYRTGYHFQPPKNWMNGLFFVFVLSLIILGFFLIRHFLMNLKFLFSHYIFIDSIFMWFSWIINIFRP